MKKVSVITPWYNGIAFVDRYMKMILAQTYSYIELIFIDDGSTDGVIEKIHEYEPIIKKRGFQFIYIFQQHAGQAEALNKGLKVFTGDYVMSVDSDDILVPECIEKRVEFLDHNLKYSMVTSKGWEADEKDLETLHDVYWMQTKEEENLFWRIVNRQISTFLLPYLFRGEDLKKVIPEQTIYVNDKNTIQDIQVSLPMAYNYKCGFIDEYLFIYVIREASGCHEFISYPHKMYYYDGLEEIWLNTYKRMQMCDEDRKKAVQKTKNVHAGYRNTMICNYILQHSDRDILMKQIFQKRKLVIFGAGEFGEMVYRILSEKNFEIDFFIDNSHRRQKEGFCGKLVKMPKYLKNFNDKFIVLVVGSFHNEEMGEELKQLGLIEGKDFYLYPSTNFMNEMNFGCTEIN